MKTHVLRRLCDERIFSVERDEDGLLVFTEACDNFFSLRLTNSEVLRLISELIAVLDGTAEETP